MRITHRAQGALAAVAVVAALAYPALLVRRALLPRRTTAHGVFHMRAEKGPPGRVYVIGDSLAADWQRVPAWAPLLLGGWECFGVPGDRTREVEHRLLDGELLGQPRGVVLIVGTNDIREGEDGATTARRIVEIAAHVARLAPTARLVVIGVPMAHSEAEACNRALAADRGFAYIAPESAVGGGDGLDADGIHLTRQGYERLTPLVLSLLREP